MLIKLHRKHGKGCFTQNDILINKNVEVVLINTNFIYEITPFSIDTMKGCFPHFKHNYLCGSKSTIWFNYIDNDSVTETVEEIYAMINKGV